jgi:hypothetical protein
MAICQSGQFKQELVRLKSRFQRFETKAAKELNSTRPFCPPYLRKTKSVEEVLPWLYLKEISTGDFQEALEGPFGSDA